MTNIHLLAVFATTASAGSLMGHVRLRASQSITQTELEGVTQPSQHGSNKEDVQRAEGALIARVCAGEKNLFYELVRPYERGIYVAAFSVLQNEQDAEEVAQEAVLKAFTHLARFRGE